MHRKKENFRVELEIKDSERIRKDSGLIFIVSQLRVTQPAAVAGSLRPVRFYPPRSEAKEYFARSPKTPPPHSRREAGSGG